jgi:hypothetical protein
MRAVAAVAKSAFMVIGVLLGYFLRRKSASSAGLGLAWAFAELPCGWRSADFLTGRMAKGLTAVAVSDGKAGFYVGTLFAYELVRLDSGCSWKRCLVRESQSSPPRGDGPDTRRDKSPGDSHGGACGETARG